MVTAMSENMRIYQAFERTPDTAKKPIEAGRLKGKTDINPMHRIKQLTERFGPCGLGWYTEITRQVMQEGPNGELMCFIDLNLYYRENGQGEWSKPVYGCGGNSIISKESKGLYANDEGWKMAYTDALSIACKNLGMCADVYYQKDYGKYTQPRHESSEAAPAEQEPKPQKPAAPPAQPQQPLRMAAPGQKQFIIENASDEQYQALMQAYGAELENLTYKTAAKAIEKIQRGMNGNG